MSFEAVDLGNKGACSHIYTQYTLKAFASEAYRRLQDDFYAENSNGNNNILLDLTMTFGQYR